LIQPIYARYVQVQIVEETLFLLAGCGFGTLLSKWVKACSSSPSQYYG